MRGLHSKQDLPNLVHARIAWSFLEKPGKLLRCLLRTAEAYEQICPHKMNVRNVRVKLVQCVQGQDKLPFPVKALRKFEPSLPGRWIEHECLACGCLSL